MLVQNNGEFSEIIKTTVGVRQGGTSSPKLFSIYISPLIKKIKESDEGLKLVNIKLDILVYADDILIINTTKRGLQNQLNIVENYGNEYDLKYNPSKTVLMIENMKRDHLEIRRDIWQDKLRLCNSEINKVLDTRYLGFELSGDGKSEKHIKARKQKTVASNSSQTK